MITYEKAKQLYGKGTPFNSIIPVTEANMKYIEYPNLTQLIDACGDRFYGITRDMFERDWIAGEDWDYDSFDGSIGYGDTPEEAVANLYLELNKK